MISYRQADFGDYRDDTPPRSFLKEMKEVNKKSSRGWITLNYFPETGEVIGWSYSGGPYYMWVRDTMAERANGIKNNPDEVVGVSTQVLDEYLKKDRKGRASQLEWIKKKGGTKPTDDYTTHMLSDNPMGEMGYKIIFNGLSVDPELLK